MLPDDMSPDDIYYTILIASCQGKIEVEQTYYITTISCEIDFYFSVYAIM